MLLSIYPQFSAGPFVPRIQTEVGVISIVVWRAPSYRISLLRVWGARGGRCRLQIYVTIGKAINVLRETLYIVIGISH